MANPAPEISGELRPGMRRLSVAPWIGLVVVYLAIIQLTGLALTSGIHTKYASPTTVNVLWRSLTLPIGLSMIFVIAIVAALRWWQPVLVERKQVQNWVIAIPLLMIFGILVATNYGGLSDRGLGFTLLLLLTTLMVGFTEEAMFRGVGLTVFRTNNFTEGKAALWSTIIFGLAHASNLISEGPKAFIQVLIAAVSGYFFYLVRRRSGGLALPALLHGLWDFALISSAVVPHKSYAGSAVVFLVLIAMAITVFVRRHRIEPAAA